MTRILTAFTLALLMAACSSGTPPGIRTTDAIEFRSVLEEDPLAIKVTMPDETEIIVGDVILNDRGVYRAAVNENKEGGFDIELTLSERESVRMEEFWGGRRSTRQALIIKDGKPWRIVDGTILKAENKLLLANFSATEQEANEYADRIVLWKQEKKPKAREE